MTKLLMIHPKRCTGCRNCVLACSFVHERQFRPAASRIHVCSWEREGFSIPMMCQQCDDAPCAAVCPTQALTHDKAAMKVSYDQSRCIGCRMCVLACPFGSATYDVVTGAILKCDTCGGDPKCVAYCPTQAIEYLEDSIATRSRKKAYAAKLKAAFEEV